MVDRSNRTIRIAAPLLMLGFAITGANAAEADEPSALVSAFNDTCRRGFPDLGAIKTFALAHGWKAQKSRLISATGPETQNSVLPDTLQKGELTLILATANPIGMKHSCQISSRAGESVSTAQLAQGMSVALKAGNPDYKKIRGAVLATWRVQSDMLVQASVNTQGPVRSASLQVRIEQ